MNTKTTPGPQGRPRMDGPSDIVVEQGIERPDMRRQMHGDPRAAAAARAKEIMEHLGTLDVAEEDKFYIPKEIIPDGWSYEWKRWSVLNKEDPAYISGVLRMGWSFVPASRHPEYMPYGTTDDKIFRDGVVLMERPKEITEAVNRLDYKRARDQVEIKKQQLRDAPPDTIERKLAKVSNSWEKGMPVPD
jgi:hypothetical protein